MKKVSFIAVTAMAMIMAASSFSYARVGVGIVVGPGWGPWWGWPYPYYSYYAPAPSPVIIQEGPETYIQRQPQAEESSYWYFCRDPKGYYPYVKKCPSGWQRIVPPSASPDEGE